MARIGGVLLGAGSLVSDALEASFTTLSFLLGAKAWNVVRLQP
jgi:hypothetical protein